MRLERDTAPVDTSEPCGLSHNPMLRHRWISLPLLVAVCALGWAPLAHAAEITFATRTDWPLGAAAHSLAVARINGDPLLDLVVASDQGLAVLFGNRSGSLSSPVLVRHQPVPAFVVAGDFDGDGRSDLAVAGRTEPAVHLLFGTGDGGFERDVKLPLSGRVLALHSADIDRDGKADLLAGWGGGIALWLGRSERAFPGPYPIDTEDAPGRAFQTADVDGDQRMDLVLLEANGEAVGFFRGDGDRNFEPRQASFAGSEPRALAALQDLDGDFLLDLAITDGLGVSVLKGDGKGAFAAPVRLARGDDFGPVAVVDLDRDGIFDLAAVDQRRGTIRVWHNAGRAQFEDRGEFSVGAQPTSLGALDLDGDGYPELLTANSLGRSVTVVRSRAGELDGIPAFDVGPDPTEGVVLDANRDGHLDLAVIHREAGLLTVSLNDGSGRFRPHFSFRTGEDPRAIVAADFDANGTDDLAVANFASDDLAIFAGNGRGEYAAPLLLATGLGPIALAVGDFNQDGRIDLASANSLSDSISVFWGDGQGRFPHTTNFAVVVRPSFLLSGDLNRDGLADLVAGSSRSDHVSIVYGRSGGLAESAESGEFSKRVRPVVAADFDGDGVVDVVKTDEFNDRVAVHPGIEGQELDLPRYFPVGRQPTAALPGDFNNDGKPDLVVLHRRNRLALLLLNTTQRSGPTTRAPLPPPQPPTPADPWQTTREPW